MFQVLKPGRDADPSEPGQTIGFMPLHRASHLSLFFSHPNPVISHSFDTTETTQIVLQKVVRLS